MLELYLVSKPMGCHGNHGPLQKFERPEQVTKNKNKLCRNVAMATNLFHQQMQALDE